MEIFFFISFCLIFPLISDDFVIYLKKKQLDEINSDKNQLFNLNNEYLSVLLHEY